MSKTVTYNEMDWDEIVKNVDLNRLDLFGRSIEGEARYQSSCQNIREKYGSVSRYIYDVKLLPLRQEIELLGKDVLMEKTSINQTCSLTRPRVLFVENDFSYYTKPLIKHHLIWSLEEWNDTLAIQAFLEQKLPNCRIIFFINPMHLRSVKDIFHIHVFSQLVTIPNATDSLE
ncbi:hypothetical protein DSO57_1014030 [Entomophthora muscae]|uniref:Uncharacterized protein n=1 Tax=Entomophthora muscae TaxID=34485 RepID=A0ACC2U3Q4_9FUNG|nr:hypothetical protein DSO57_1014030 [Entomophthora muscae]